MFTKLKQFFIPRAENNYHPHLLHTKRAVFYALVFATLKVMTLLVVLLLPEEVYLHPDILQEQYQTILQLTNQTRADNHVPALTTAIKLNVSAQLKANDMAKYQYFSHTSPSGHTLAYFLGQAGYDYTVAGENLAVGFSDPASLVAAWKASPKHFENLVDPDFKEVGIGLESGVYRDEPVVYVAEHFGASVDEPLAPITVPTDENGTSTVAGIKIVPGATTIDEDHSWLYWLERGDSTVLQARVAITGVVDQASVTIGSYTIPLAQLATTTVYAGQITVPGTADQFFGTLVLPSVTVKDAHGQEIFSTINWFNIKPHTATLAERYATAKMYLAPTATMFGVTTDVYIFFIAFFSLALLANITVEIRRQHYHIIVQTLLLIGLLGSLAWI